MRSYRGLALAPMVRVGELPMRLAALKYGADLVWGPEIVDKKIITCRRVWNPNIECVDFVDPTDTVAFRTKPSVEKSRLVFQMGTASPDLAVQAARVIAQDVSRIDVNSGCPKHFSVHSGMGAALLRTPHILEAILSRLVQEIGKPLNISISVKIRLLETKEQTLTLVRRLVQTGIENLTVHCRTVSMRNHMPPIREYMKEIADICRGHGVSCVLNGQVQSRADLPDILNKYSVDGAMIASAAEKNVSCFRELGPLPWHETLAEYIRQCRLCDNRLANTKYCLLSMVPGKSPWRPQLAAAKSYDALDVLVQDLLSNYEASLHTGRKRAFDEGDFSRKRQSLTLAL